MKTVFLASGNHFLPFPQTATSGSSFSFNWNIFFSQSFIPASGNEISRKQYCFIPRFFLSVETSIKIWGNFIFIEKPYPC